jgi:hypothetical protein
LLRSMLAGNIMALMIVLLYSMGSMKMADRPKHVGMFK